MLLTVLLLIFLWVAVVVALTAWYCFANWKKGKEWKEVNSKFEKYKTNQKVKS